MAPLVGTVWVGDKFSARYVNNLYAAVRRNTDRDFSFVCITDNNTTELNPKIDTKTPENDVWGWWHFMEFYNPGFTDRTRIYLGLDTVITGNIDRLLRQDKFTLSRDFNYLIGNTSKLYANTYADCAAVIPAEGNKLLYETFLTCNHNDKLAVETNPIHVWVTHMIRNDGPAPFLWQDIEPKLLCSYKWPEIKVEQPPEPMVFFHGVPAVHAEAKKGGWVKEHWHEGGV